MIDLTYRLTLSLLILCIVFFSIPALYAEYNEGDIVSNFTLRDMEGNPVNLFDYDGYVIQLYFFKWWCPYCESEATLDILLKKLKPITWNCPFDGSKIGVLGFSL